MSTYDESIAIGSIKMEGIINALNLKDSGIPQIAPLKINPKKNHQAEHYNHLPLVDNNNGPPNVEIKNDPVPIKSKYVVKNEQIIAEESELILAANKNTFIQGDSFPQSKLIKQKITETILSNVKPNTPKKSNPCSKCIII